MRALQRHQLLGVVGCACRIVERPRGDGVGFFEPPGKAIQEVDGRVCPQKL